MLNNVWWSSHTKHASSSRSTIALLFGSECWQMTETDLRMLLTYHTKGLRKNLADSLASDYLQQGSAYTM